MPKSLDGIVKRKPNQSKFGGIKVSVTVIPQNPVEWMEQHNTPRSLYYPKLPIFLTAGLMLAAFLGGMWYNMETKNTEAQSVPPLPINNFVIPIQATQEDFSNLSAVPNDVVFNLPIDQLEKYLDEQDKKLAEERQEQILQDRTAKLKIFLRNKSSPFEKYAGLIARQSHWKLILAISFAESTLGKYCNANNCSGIGVAPGHPSWRKYGSLEEWIVDFNGLLERRYKDWSLEQMNGVYVQPQNPNWLLATKQILSELQQAQIE